MDGEKLSLEERFAPASTTSPPNQAILSEEVERRSSPVVNSCAELSTFHPENLPIAALLDDMPTGLEQSLNLAFNEVPVVAHEKYRSPFSDDLEKRLKATSKDASSAADDNGGHHISAESQESLKSTSKDMSTAAEDSGRPPSSTELEDRLNEEVKDLPMVAPAGGVRSATAPELEMNSTHPFKDKSMVDCVTDDMVKVSIQQAMNSNKEPLQEESGDGLKNGKGRCPQSHSGCELIFASEAEDASIEHTYNKPLCNDDQVEVIDNTSPQEMDCKMRAESSKDNRIFCVIKDSNKAENIKDLNGHDDTDDSEDDHDDDRDDDDDSVTDEDEDVEVEQESEDSDSSSSTSTLSFSSSSDEDEIGHYRLPKNVSYQKDLVMEAESECEEGELKESPSQRKKIISKKKAMVESSEDEGGPKGPLQSMKEMKNLPRVPKVSVTLQPHHTMVPVGFVSSLVGVNVIVEGIEGAQPLSEGSILWMTEERLPLGVVDELFGPVKKPFYVVRYNDTTELPEGVREGAQVSYVRDFADFVLNNPDLYAKGYDKSADNDEVVSDSEVEFSDDEKEAEYKRLKTRTKRGNSELGTSDMDSRQHQEGKTQGKGFNKDNRNQRSRGDNARTLQFNNDFSGRAPRQKSRSQQHRGEGDPTFLYHQCEQEPPFQHSRMEPMQTSSERQHGKRSPALQVRRSHQSRGMGQPKSWRPPGQAVSMSDEVNLSQWHAHASKTDKIQASPGPISHEEVQPTQSNQSSQSTSWEPHSPKGNQSRSFMQPSPDFMQSTSQKTQINHMQSNLQKGQMNQAHNPMQANLSHSFMQQAPQQAPLQYNQSLNHIPKASQQGQMRNQPQMFMQSQAQVNQPHGYIQPMLPQPQSWPMNQPPVSSQMALPQRPEVQHSQMPVYNAAVVVGQGPQVAGSGYGIPTTNNVSLQSGMGMGQGVLPMHQATMFQQVSSSNQLSSFGPHQFSAQVPSNMGLPTGNHIQVAHVDGYSIGMQSTDFSTPVLGIPAGPVSASTNYSLQVINSQPYSGFTPGGAPPVGNQGLPSTFGVPDQSQRMQPSPGTSAGSWQQQYSPQGSHWQQPYQQRPRYGKAPHRRYGS